MTRSRFRTLFDGAALGLALTLLIVALDLGGALRVPERFLYDQRARRFQHYARPATDRLVHLDIDDAALGEIGRWPWHRDQMARIVDEVRLAGPTVLAMDVLFSEPEGPRRATGPDGVEQTIEPDAALAAAMARAGNVLVSLRAGLDRPPPPLPCHDPDVQVLQRDPEVELPRLVAAVRHWGVGGPDVAADVERDYPSALREALSRRADEAIGMDPAGADYPSLRARLLPRSAATGVRGEADVALEKVLPQALAARAFEDDRFTKPPQPGLPPLVESGREEATIAPLAAAAAYCGYVDYLGQGDGAIRSIPLFVAHRGRLLPQAGLALACAYLGVPVGDVGVAADRVTLRPPGRPEIVIPVHPEPVDGRGEMNLFLDVPWVGTGEWMTMYDFPDHRAARQHVPVLAVWDACRATDQIAENDAAATADVEAVLAKNDSEKLAAFRAARPPLGDADAWDRLMADALAAVDPSTLADYARYLDPAAAADPSALGADERPYVMALRNLRRRQDINRGAVETRGRVRASLRNKLGGRAVLFGWIADGGTDKYNTPLHTQCPGSVVHGAIFNGIVTGELWRTAPRWQTAAVTAALGVAVTLAAVTLGPWQSMAVAAALGLGYALLNCVVLFDRGNTILGLAGPLTAVAGVWSACTLARFVRVSAERTFITAQFQAHVDPALVDYLMDHPDRAAFEGEERELTVVFTDLAGFTTVAEQLKREAVPLIKEYLALMEPVIRKHHGLVNKFLGDGIMFFYGAPEPYPGDPAGHAAAAVATVLEMQRVMTEFNANLRARDLPELKVRAGVSTGMMVVGNAGTPRRADYTVLGDRVNFAARLESANKYTGTLVLLSERTVELLDNKYLVRPVGRLQVVGKKESVMTFEPLAPAREATPDQRELARRTKAVVDSFGDAEFDGCCAALDALEALNHPGSAKLCDLYRRTCAQHRANPPRVFSGQISFTEK